jgi:hypothetical protein
LRDFRRPSIFDFFDSIDPTATLATRCRIVFIRFLPHDLDGGTLL